MEALQDYCETQKSGKQSTVSAVERRTEMRILNNDKGIALVTSLMFTMLSLVICMALLYMVTSGARTSGAYKRYKTALDASYGGTEIATKDLIGQALKILPSATADEFRTSFQGALGSLSSPTFSDCLQMRTNLSSKEWTGACANPTINPTSAPDITFNLNADSGSQYKVYTKIVDTREWRFTSFSTTAAGVPVLIDNRIAGNTDRSSTETLGKGATSGGKEVKVPHYPYVYKIEIQGESVVNPAEKANISAMYAY